jgi:hypothetical protein
VPPQDSLVRSPLGSSPEADQNENGEARRPRHLPEYLSTAPKEQLRSACLRRIPQAWRISIPIREIVHAQVIHAPFTYKNISHACALVLNVTYPQVIHNICG